MTLMLNVKGLKPKAKAFNVSAGTKPFLHKLKKSALQSSKTDEHTSIIDQNDVERRLVP